MKAREKALKHALLQAQRDLATRDYPVIIVLGGLPGAGKSELVHQLNEWLDPRFVTTSAQWKHSDEEEDRPYYWRFWRHMPPRGRMTIFLGSWYTQLLYDGASGRLEPGHYDQQLKRIRQFERMLRDEGVLLVKVWLQVERATQQRRLTADSLRLRHLPASARAWAEDYAAAQRAAKTVLQGSDGPEARWQTVDADDPHERNLIAGETLLQMMNAHVARGAPGIGETAAARSADGGRAAPSQALTTLPRNLQLGKQEYRALLREQQQRLQKLAWQAHDAGRSLIAVFEGWDAAGKGSAIRRVTAPVDPRLYRVIQSSAPSDEERAHHYLWRYWRSLERRGRIMLFDRSWYGRVLVERVEGFAHLHAWQRAYAEINDFESQLAEHGSIIVKFWLHISPEEQLKRFREREHTPHKQHKITADDWRNRARWSDYEQAVLDMLQLTSTATAPWTVVAANDKRYARVHILQTLCDALETALGTQ